MLSCIVEGVAARGRLDGSPIRTFHAKYDDAERKPVRHLEWSHSPLMTKDAE